MDTDAEDLAGIQGRLSFAWHTEAIDCSFFLPDAVDVAPQLLGYILEVDSPGGPVGVRITETEAHIGVGTAGRYEPGSHSKDRKTPRNASMFLEAGRAHVYFSNGLHFALNLVCSPAGIASGVLVRAGQILDCIALAAARRHAKRPLGKAQALKEPQLARGPGNLATTLGITREAHDGRGLFAAPYRFLPPAHPVQGMAAGPRVGVAGIVGGPEFPWRFWLPGEPGVSAFRPGRNAPR
ncbi:DNA-3-methyladenine glycosylase [Glutamicibacter arilaitensis]|uniref:DNA-3-methyladenine glycosylase n=1 Tax=Glutamicibacter arilaitensis TaxID=256701 RepID=UPI003FD34A0E